MECKLFNGSIIKDGKIHLSSTILECKLIFRKPNHFTWSYLSSTILECKFELPLAPNKYPGNLSSTILECKSLFITPPSVKDFLFK